MRLLDVRKGDRIVVYDHSGMVSAPRAYWMFKVFGAERVKVLNGSLARWLKEGNPVSTIDNAKEFAHIICKDREPGTDEDFDYKLNKELLFEYEDLEKNNDIILDSRPSFAFNQGHIPDARLLPFNSVLSQDN